MRIFKRLAIVSLFVLGWTPAADATVDVIFVNPGGYTDSSFSSRYSGEASEFVLREIRAHLVRLGERYLKQDQRLEIEVLDIDLAGRYEPWHRYALDVRFLRAVTWPRIKVRYSLLENGTVIAGAEETVSDLTYFTHPTTRYTGDRLPYEKVMLENWFRTRFAELRPPPA